MAINFRDATDEIFSGVEEDALAASLSCSVATIRQARLRDGAKAKRSAPKQWERAVIKLAEQKIERLKRLTAKLKDLV